jgi:hypothetical protein
MKGNNIIKGTKEKSWRNDAILFLSFCAVRGNLSNNGKPFPGRIQDAFGWVQQIFNLKVGIYKVKGTVTDDLTK